MIHGFRLCISAFPLEDSFGFWDDILAFLELYFGDSESFLELNFGFFDGRSKKTCGQLPILD